MPRVPALRAVFAALVVTSVGGCLPPEPRAGGAISAGPQALAFSSCVSGEHRGFFGVDLTDETGRTLRLVDDPIEGVRGRYSALGGDLAESGAILDARSCRVLRATILPTSWRINKIRVVQGSATLDCELPDNTPLRGEVFFEGCS